VPKEDHEHWCTDGKHDRHDDRKRYQFPARTFFHVAALSAESLCPGVALLVIRSRLTLPVSTAHFRLTDYLNSAPVVAPNHAVTRELAVKVCAGEAARARAGDASL
jgi:hypothetical protein